MTRVRQSALDSTITFIILHELIHVAYRDAEVANYQTKSGGEEVHRSQEFGADEESLNHAISAISPRFEEHIFFQRPPERPHRFFPNLAGGPLFWPKFKVEDLEESEAGDLLGLAVGLWTLFGSLSGVGSGDHPPAEERWQAVYEVLMPMPWRPFLNLGASVAIINLGITTEGLRPMAGATDVSSGWFDRLTDSTLFWARIRYKQAEEDEKRELWNQVWGIRR